MTISPRSNTLGSAGDALEGAQPILERAFAGLDQNMLDPGLAIGREPCQPSASFTARASAASELPPIQIGIGLTGSGSMRMSSMTARHNAVPNVRWFRECEG